MCVDLNAYYLDSDFQLPIPMSQTKLDGSNAEDKAADMTSVLEDSVAFVGEDVNSSKQGNFICYIVVTIFNYMHKFTSIYFTLTYYEIKLIFVIHFVVP